MTEKGNRRIVQVIIVDPDPKCPLEIAVLHLGESHATDRTDEELFYELDLMGLLKDHNEKRREQKLGEIRLSDLRREVRTILRF